MNQKGSNEPFFYNFFITLRNIFTLREHTKNT